MPPRKKKNEKPADTGDSAPEAGKRIGTEFSVTTRLRPAFRYRLNQIANRESRRAGRKVPVGEIIEREMQHWVAEQWAEIQAED